jgi:hypothetical protein
MTLVYKCNGSSGVFRETEYQVARAESDPGEWFTREIIYTRRGNSTGAWRRAPQGHALALHQAVDPGHPPETFEIGKTKYKLVRTSVRLPKDA